MAVRIKWDEYETALLIETFWKIENNEEKRCELIEELSNRLRQKAIKSGLSIDDVYRNYNGINMQLSIIGHEFFPERSGLNRTKLFTKMVNLYKTDKDSFDLILSRAHDMF